MNVDFLWTVPEEKLLQGLKDCLKLERKHKTMVLFHLAEVDRRMLYAAMGYPSLIEFCQEELGLSESSALKRIQVARLMIRFPEITPMAEEGKISLSVLSRLSPHLSPENRTELLEKSRGKSVREVEEILRETFGNTEGEKTKELRLKATEAWLEKMEQVRELFCEDVPSRNIEALIEKSFDFIIKSLDPADKTKEPRRVFSKEGQRQSRYIPRGIRKEVWKRDGGQCAFRSDDGKRCGAMTGLQWGHCIAYALGGSSKEASNIKLVCRTHNKFESLWEILRAQERESQQTKLLEEAWVEKCRKFPHLPKRELSFGYVIQEERRRGRPGV